MKVHHVKSARPCNSEKEAEKRHAAGVEVEQSYYWWNESRGPGKRYSRYRPKRSQLTRTRWSLVYMIEESFQVTTGAQVLQNNLEAGVEILKKLQTAYPTPAPEHVRTEANFQAKAERVGELARELGEYLDAVADLVDAQGNIEEVLQEILDLNWDIPTKAE